MIFTSEEMFRARAKELTAYFGRPVETGCDLFGGQISSVLLSLFASIGSSSFSQWTQIETW
jgi:hypothetical protein